MNYPPFRPGRPQGPQPRGPQPRALYDGQGPGPAQRMRGQQPPASRAIIPTNVLQALISQSRKRCASYVEMMQKLGQGVGQLDLESRQMMRGHERDPIVMGQLREYFDTVRELAELNEQKVAQLIQQEVQFQQVLQMWLYGRPLEPRRPGPAIQSHQGPALRNAPPAAMGPQRAPAREPATASEVAIPTAAALSGYAAHALEKSKAAKQVRRPPQAQPPQAQPPQAQAQAPAPPRSEPKPPPEREETPAPKLAEKSNGPGSHAILESKAEPEPALPAPEREGS